MFNNTTSTQPIAKEGWKSLATAIVLFALAYMFSFFAWFFFIVLLFTAYLYRNPERIVLEDDSRCLIAPIDGKVTHIAKTILDDGSEMLKIVIQKSWWDVGVLRAPMSMEIEKMTSRFGFGMRASEPLFSLLNERKIVTCKTQDGLVKMVLCLGQYGFKIHLFQMKNRLKVGERIGFLNDGNVALLVPLDTRLKVVLKDTLKAGESVLGYLAYKDDNERK